MTGTRPDGHKEISAIIVPSGTPGFVVGQRYSKVGWNASDTRELSFTDVRVPEENLVGERGRGYAQFLSILDEGRIAISALSVGLAQGCVDESIKYAAQREAFGQPIGRNQAIQFMIADMEVRASTARLAYYRAAEKMLRGEPFKREASIAKLYSSEMAMDNARYATQVHGGYGFMNEFPVGRFYRDAKILEIGEGTSEVQRMLIARDLGGDGCGGGGGGVVGGGVRGTKCAAGAGPAPPGGARRGGAGGGGAALSAGGRAVPRVGDRAELLGGEFHGVLAGRGGGGVPRSAGSARAARPGWQARGCRARPAPRRRAWRSGSAAALRPGCGSVLAARRACTPRRASQLVGQKLQIGDVRSQAHAGSLGSPRPWPPGNENGQAASRRALGRSVSRSGGDVDEHLADDAVLHRLVRLRGLLQREDVQRQAGLLGPPGPRRRGPRR